MKLWMQNIVVLLPVFLGMTCIIGLSRYTAEMHEIRWGLSEEIASYATSIAEFLSGDAYREIVQQLANGSGKQDATSPLQRIMSGGRIQRLIIYGAAGQRPLSTWGKATEPGQEPVPADVLTKLQKHGLVVSDPSAGGATEGVMRAYAPIMDGEQALAGILLIAIDASEIATRSKQIIQQITIESGVILLIGLCVIIGISIIVSRPIDTLCRLVTGEVTEADYEQDGMISIQEFSDLGNTFDTMRNVLEESETRINRSLIQSTQFRSRADLARAYVEDVWQPIHGVYGSTEVAGRLLGERFAGSFFGVVARADGLYALVGRIQGQGDLDPVVMASGACSFMKEDLRHRDPVDTFQRTAEIFIFESFACVQCVDDQVSCTLWTMDTLDLAPQFTQKPFQPPDTVWPINNQYLALQHNQQPFQVGHTMIIHTFSGDIAAKIEVYLRQLHHLPPEELMHELTVFLGPQCDGAVVLLKHREASHRHAMLSSPA